MKMIFDVTKEDNDKMVSRLNFNTDVGVGYVGEYLGKKYVEQLGYTFISGPPEDDLKAYDLLCSHGEHFKTFECKTDVRCKPPYKEYNIESGEEEIKTPDTFNIFIEYSCNDKDSGIVTTKSDYWFYVFYYLKEIWTIPTPNLRKLIEENDFETGRGGDNNKAFGYLIKKNKFKEHFKKTDFQLNII